MSSSSGNDTSFNSPDESIKKPDKKKMKSNGDGIQAQGAGERVPNSEDFYNLSPANSSLF